MVPQTGYAPVASSGRDDGGEPSGEAPPQSSGLAIPGGTRTLALGALAVVAVLVAVSGAGSSLIEAVEGIAGADSGWVGPAAFVAAYAAATVLLFPASVLTLVAGAVYGPWAGTALVSAASTLGAVAAFLVSRYAARPLVETRLGEYPKMQAVVRGISDQGAKIVLLLRLSPLFPFNVLNYALGLTSISLPAYAAASWAGMLPGTFAYVFLGSTGRAAADAASGGGFEPVKLVLYGVGAVATLAVTKVAADAASRALEESQQGQPQEEGRQ